MTLVLALDTSARTFAVAAGSDDQPSAKRTLRREDPAFAGLGDLAAGTLADAGATFSGVGMIGVDVGPGGLSSIRSAVAYANGLAFSLGVPVFAASSLELMALDAAEQGHRDAVLCLKRGQGGNVYAALFSGGESSEMRHGMPDVVLPMIVGKLAAVSVAGIPAVEVADLLNGVTVRETGIADADVDVLYQTARQALAQPERLVRAATPLNEASPLFHKPASRR